MSRARWTDAVRYVHTRVAVRDLLRRLVQELAFPGITADLVDDVDRRTLWPGSCERVWQWRPRLKWGLSPVTPQDWSRWGVLVLHHLLDDTMCHTLELIHQAF